MDRKDTMYSRRQVEGMIARGKTVIIVDGHVLHVDSWLKYHPGGDKAIMHMIGRDATDEVNALHSVKARQRMNAFRIGRVEGPWKNFVPPIQGGSFRAETDEKVIQDQAPPEEDDEDSVQDSESSSGSLEPSPIFEPISGASVRRVVYRRQSGASSNTSMSSLDQDDSFDISKESPQDVRTQQELDRDLAKYPSLDATTQTTIVSKYRLLNQRIKAEGLYDCNYRAYFVECFRYLLFFSLSIIFLHAGWYGTSGLFLGIFWHQLVFTAHDAGHMGITHDFTTDTVIGIIIADFLGGLSLGWWKRNHNVHHIVTNSPEHDPDIEHMPMFAISHRFFDSLRSTYYERVMTYDPVAKFMVRYQHYLYYPILTLGRFNLYRLSWEYLILGLGPRKGPAWWHRWLEIAGQVFFWSWFGYGMVYRSIPTMWGRIAFVMISHMVTAPLHVQITLSHFAMSTADLGVNESFPQRMLRTTMDVDCPEWLDFVHGGLQFQAIHHLYPRIPRHNLRRTQKLVQEFCNEVSIPYALYGFVDGNKEVIGRLGDVGRQAAVFAECQKVAAAKVVLEGH
ncbi:MAG: Delta 8 Fatty Acid Desaturase [Chrysothrix sp. TS-e1954]|nr:MAG: Delta 8 Fatty Acid Desaturase [Chrysothrix sp. TS-e1954]